MISLKLRKQSALKWVIHLAVLFLVLLWLFPTIGLFVSSFRTSDQISSGGWWSSLFASEQNLIIRAEPPEKQVLINGKYSIIGNLFDENSETQIRFWGISSRKIDEYKPGDEILLKDNIFLKVEQNGDYSITSEDPISGSRGQRIFVSAIAPPKFTFSNYYKVLFDDSNTEGMSNAFLNTLTVTIPATIIPILIAAFAAYALAWMEFPLRSFLVATIVGLIVVPLHLALIPLLKLHLDIGIGKGYMGVWLAHTGFGMPLAIYLLRNYMVGIPRDVIENARVDGATEFQIFTRIILPLSFPALASFSIFQFLWTWNDLLVAKVFLIDATGETTVMTAKIIELLGTRGGNWEILATSAFVSIVIPLCVFFFMQKYLVRGLLSGSIK